MGATSQSVFAVPEYLDPLALEGALANAKNALPVYRQALDKAKSLMDEAFCNQADIR